MLKADIGDILYIVIFALLMLAGGLEKYVKAKRQKQQDGVPSPPLPRSEYEEEEHPVPQQASPQTLEEMLKPTEAQEESGAYSEEAQSLEVITEAPVRKSYYQPVVSHESPIASPSEKAAFAVPALDEEKKLTAGLFEYDFDLRRAIISSEILNRKY
jgi:hypothetical protein